MARIIPWTLPPVNGGSIGGYTPQPTPTPTPTQQYYDLTNLSIVRSPAYGSPDDGSGIKVTISGILPDNLVGVASVAIHLYESAGSTQAEADAAEPSLWTWNVSSMTNPNRRLDGWSVGKNKYCHISKIQLVMFNGNGEVLDYQTLTEDLDGGA